MDTAVYLTPAVAGYGSITGTVIGPTGAPSTLPIQINLLGLPGEILVDFTITTTGSFSFPNVFVGSYRVEITPPFSPTALASVDVFVSCDMETSVQFELKIGRMTGGGRVDTGVFTPPRGRGGRPQQVQTTHGFELWVNPDFSLGGNLQYNDHRSGDAFHVTEVRQIYFYDDSALDPRVPTSGFDTAMVRGVGRLNGVDGLRFGATITDAGEPGRNDSFSIRSRTWRAPAFPGLCSKVTTKRTDPTRPILSECGV